MVGLGRFVGARIGRLLNVEKTKIKQLKIRMTGFGKVHITVSQNVA